MRPICKDEMEVANVVLDMRKETSMLGFNATPRVLQPYYSVQTQLFGLRGYIDFDFSDFVYPISRRIIAQWSKSMYDSLAWRLTQ